VKPASGSTAILSASLIIVMLGFGLVVPIMPFYVTHFGATGKALGALMALYSLCQFIFAPIWGRLSDRIGRKPVLLIGVAGFLASFGLQGMARSLAALFVARTLSGVLSSAALPTALAYIADTTQARDRSKGMGIMGAAMGFGMIFGPMMGGPLTLTLTDPPAWLAPFMLITPDATGQPINLSMPFYSAATLALLALPFILVMLPESLPPERRQAQPSGGPGGSRFELLLTALRGEMGLLYALAFFLSFALANFESTIGLHIQDYFGVGPLGFSMIMVAIGTIAVVQQGVMIGPLTRRFGEVGLLRGGLTLSLIGMVMLALATHFWILVIGGLVMMTGNTLLRPSSASLISQQTRSTQGLTMGLENSFMSLGRIGGPLVGGWSYDIAWPLPYWTAATISLGMLIAVFTGLKPTPRSIDQTPDKTPTPVERLSLSSEA
jgi:DHA1 family multidrug resistance protein-like MFS transporter